MSKRTKKAGSVGRFGARYGVRIRRRVREVELKQKGTHTCPSCGAEKVRRVSAGIWSCRKCAHTFAGGAYVPATAQFRTSERTLRDIVEKGGKSALELELEAAQARAAELALQNPTPEPEPEAEEAAADEPAADEEERTDEA